MKLCSIGELYMKLLIVDDEELTRTGLISSIDWDSLGITEILQADDGVNGLEMAKLYKPEIILCDVRMPRMTGIAMLERLEKFLPDSIPIFMSGYSESCHQTKSHQLHRKASASRGSTGCSSGSADSLQTKAPLPSWRSDPFPGNRHPAGTTADSSTFR